MFNAIPTNDVVSWSKLLGHNCARLRRSVVLQRGNQLSPQNHTQSHAPPPQSVHSLPLSNFKHGIDISKSRGNRYRAKRDSGGCFRGRCANLSITIGTRCQLSSRFLSRKVIPFCLFCSMPFSILSSVLRCVCVFCIAQIKLVFWWVLSGFLVKILVLDLTWNELLKTGKQSLLLVFLFESVVTELRLFWMIAY